MKALLGRWTILAWPSHGSTAEPLCRRFSTFTGLEEQGGGREGKLLLNCGLIVIMDKKRERIV